MIRIALALTIALPATAAAAQSNRKPTWDDLLKPLDVKTDPRIPVAPSPPSGVPLVNSSQAAVDRCVISALGRLPKVDGMQILEPEPKYSHSVGSYGSTYNFWDIFITVIVHGRVAHYHYSCRLTGEFAELWPFR